MSILVLTDYQIGPANPSADLTQIQGSLCREIIRNPGTIKGASDFNLKNNLTAMEVLDDTIIHRRHSH